jgi:hypothetical protein
MILSSFDDGHKNRHFPIPNHEQQPQGLRNANQAKTDSYCLDRR